MSTIYTFHQECPAATSKLQPADRVLVYDSSAGVTKYMTGALLAGAGAGVVDTTATTLTLTQASHAGKVLTVSSAAPIAITLPAATGTGDVYFIQMQVAATGTAHTIKVANTTDVMQGEFWCLTTSSDNVIGYKATSADDTISLNGTTKGGVVGDRIILRDVKSGFWSVNGFTAPTGTTATPFSATV